MTFIFAAPSPHHTASEPSDAFADADDAMCAGHITFNPPMYWVTVDSDDEDFDMEALMEGGVPRGQREPTVVSVSTSKDQMGGGKKDQMGGGKKDNKVKEQKPQPSDQSGKKNK